MTKKSLITGQDVSPEIQRRAREMRREMTPAEAKPWHRLRAGRLEGFHFRRQQVVGRFIADFYCHQTRLILEVDGCVHGERQAYDNERDNELRLQELTVLRFTNRQVEQEIEAVLATILAACVTTKKE
jgi:very-short-patch-repair endonuclease